ncbi:hypothetical protein NIES2101_02070 [Calothrix sp. HK-06]|nr:hypothetical protein NIES2101_02070 [Calothrix sp. HK-06]
MGLSTIIQVLEGNITQCGIWSDSAICYYADDLAFIRLKILERQERYQEYLYLAEAEGQTKQFIVVKAS